MDFPVSFSHGLDQPEVENLHEVHIQPHPAGKNVRWLYVSVDQASRVGFGQRLTGLPQQMHRPLRRYRAVSLDQRLQVETIEELHDEKEGAVLRDAEVVEIDGVRRAE